MNWKLIVALSGFGLAMGLATVAVIPSTVEPLCWFAIALLCAVAIGRGAPGRPFLHGLCVGLLNSVWITAAHEAFFDRYLASHAREAAMMATDAALPPRALMGLIGPVVGLASGLALGTLALIASHLVNKGATETH